MKRFNVYVATLVLLIAMQGRVHAYTDPGTGTLVWQLLVAASFGVMFYLRRIVRWARRLRGKETPREDAAATTSDQRR